MKQKHNVIAVFTLAAIGFFLLFHFGLDLNPAYAQLPLIAALVLGGIPLVYDLVKEFLKGEFGADLLAALAIITAVFLGEYFAGAVIVLMLSGGAVLESYAVENASAVLKALAKRMPSIAHRRQGQALSDAPLEQVSVGDTLVVFPHEICPVDGVVAEGHGTMDEAYLTGEPFQIDKAPGSVVISGAVNGDSALTITATKRAVDSRYAKITEVMRASEQNQPRLRRLGDQLGAFYTPVSLAVAAAAWFFSGDMTRFLAVLVIATPCPMLIGIPVAIIGSISLSAGRAIIVKNPVALEQIDTCETIIFDKTGTLTYGEPQLSDLLCTPAFDRKEVLSAAASLERYSKHPLARAIAARAQQEGVAVHEAVAISESPGDGLRGTVSGRQVRITNRKQLLAGKQAAIEQLPPEVAGMECVVIVDEKYAATFRFRDTPRAEGLSFVQHLGPRHNLGRLLIVSGDRESEVRFLAEQVGIKEVYAQQSPEQKLRIVQEETQKSKTVFVGDGINDAPALMAATVGIALGQSSDITSEAADVVIMDNSLAKLDEFLHISRRMRKIALQSAVGGMALSVVGMLLAAAGYLTPVLGAISQEAIDLLAIVNALRAAWPPRELSDWHKPLPS